VTTTTTKTLIWDRGGHATVERLDDDGAITLRSSVPSPPGSRVEGALEGGIGRLRVKIHGSKRQDDGSFVLVGRALDLTKELRERIVHPASHAELRKRPSDPAPRKKHG
jgi:hypothetical protein